jgi:Ca2+-binding EF-hand superfamily protein
MFDGDGSGSIAASELKAVLEDLGLKPTEDQVRSVIIEVDRDRSGEIEFVEFVELMHRINTGDIALGVLAQAVLDSEASKKLNKEVLELLSAKELHRDEDGSDDEEDDFNDDSTHERERKARVAQILQDHEHENRGELDAHKTAIDPLYVPGLISITMDKKQATKCVVLLEGPEDTPYEGRCFTLEVVVDDDYPFSPPHVKFTHRLMHVNFSMGLDGTTSMPQVLVVSVGCFLLASLFWLLVTFIIKLFMCLNRTHVLFNHI